MLPTWFRQLRQNLFGNKSARKPAGRKPSSVLLGVETLEGREMMSANIPGFMLSSGSLYHTVGTQQQLIDTSVQDFTVVNSKVYDLHTDSTVFSMGSDGSSKTGLNSSVQSIGSGVDQQGRSALFVLYNGNYPGRLDEYTVAAGWTTVANDVGKFAQGTGGHVYYLTGTLLHDSLGGGWSNTQDFAVTNDGTLYWLGTSYSGNLLQSQAPGQSGWTTLAAGVSKFAQGTGGHVYYLTGNVLHDSLGGGWGNTQDFAVGTGGTLYWLGTSYSGNLLQRYSQARGWEDLDRNVQSFQLVGGETAALEMNGVLNLFDGSGKHYVDSGVVSYGIDTSGAVIELDWGANLNRYTPGTGRQYLDGGVRNFQIDAAGSTVALDSAANLRRYQAGSTTRLYMDNGVTTFSLNSTGFTYALDTAGTLSRYAPGTTARQALDRNVTSFTIGKDDALRSVHANGDVWQQASNGFWTGPSVKTVVASNGTQYVLNREGYLHDSSGGGWANTRDFAVANDGTLYWLGTSYSGNLLQSQAPGQSGWTTLAGGVGKFALGTGGHVYYLMGTLLHDSLGGSWSNTQDFAVTNDGTLYWLGNLYSGNLLQKQIPGGWLNIAFHVTKFTLSPTGTCYALSANGDLSVNGKTSWSNTQDFALDNLGTLYWLGTSYSGNLLQSQAPGQSGWTTLAGGVSKLALGTGGHVYYLTGTLLHDSLGGSWSNTLDFAVTNDGTLYWLGTSYSGNLLQSQAPGQSGWTTLAGGVSKFALGTGGHVYYLTGTFLHDSAGGGWANTQDFAVNSGGTLYTLGTAANGGLLQSQAPGQSGWTTFGGGASVSKFALGTGGHVYYLTGSVLHDSLGGGWSNTQDFAIDATGTLYTLNVSRQLQQQIPGGWLNLASNVRSFATSPSGTALVLLRQNGSLDRFDPSTGADTSFIAGGVAAIAEDQTGDLLILGQNDKVFVVAQGDLGSYLSRGGPTSPPPASELPDLPEAHGDTNLDNLQQLLKDTQQEGATQTPPGQQNGDPNQWQQEMQGGSGPGGNPNGTGTGPGGNLGGTDTPDKEVPEN